LEQDVPVEVIVIDDGSNDGSLAVARKFERGCHSGVVRQRQAQLSLRLHSLEISWMAGGKKVL
jgi:glycosyltransferase involved in cell wall biosynthesis